MDFIPVRFVKGKTETEDVTTATCSYTEPTRNANSGEETKAFYEQLVGLHNDDSTPAFSKSSHVCDLDNQQCQQKTKKITPTGECKRKRRKPKTITAHSKPNHSASAFLQGVQEGDIKRVCSMLGDGVDINTQDPYGWSALMCATQAGHELVVKLLLKNGADKLITDYHGTTALDLAKQSKREKIVEMLEIGVEEDPSLKQIKSYFCSVCNASFRDTTENAHATSTIHLFNMKLQPKPTMYQITEANPGFQMMLRSGWNQEKGLGTDGQGQKFPVKTILKRDRKGFGSKSNKTAKPKVTHFGAKDLDAINKVTFNHSREMRLSTLSKKSMKRASMKERRKDIHFRREFYVD
jgi:hypothetical protein